MMRPIRFSITVELLGVVRFKTKTVPFAVEGTRGLAGGGFGV
jgi:hypothetical protein